jgi:hypothetical protein
VLALLLPLLLPTACDWSRGSHSYQPYVGLHLDFRAGDFSRDSLTGIAVDAQHGQADVHLGATDWAAGQASTVYGTAPDRSGTLESAPLNATHPFDQAIASWDAQTPTGIWLQVELRTYRPDSSRWTKYYTMAVWASGSDTILRHSVDGQTDGDGNVVTDTLALAGGPVYTRYQYRLTLVTVDPTVSPHVRLVGVMTSNSQRETVGAGTPSNHRLGHRSFRATALPDALPKRRRGVVLANIDRHGAGLLGLQRGGTPDAAAAPTTRATRARATGRSTPRSRRPTDWRPTSRASAR